MKNLIFIFILILCCTSCNSYNEKAILNETKDSNTKAYNSYMTELEKDGLLDTLIGVWKSQEPEYEFYIKDEILMVESVDGEEPSKLVYYNSETKILIFDVWYSGFKFNEKNQTLEIYIFDFNKLSDEYLNNNLIIDSPPKEALEELSNYGYPKGTLSKIK